MSMMMTTDTPIRLLRPVDPPLGLYFRPGRNDHTVLGQMLEAGHREVSGFVFDPCLEKRHRDLREATIEHQLEAILDPKSLELATAGGIARTGVASLPWSLGENLPHEPTRLAIAKHDFVERLAAHVLANGYSAVLAPTHYLDDSRDDWLPVDRDLTLALREVLDSAGGQSVLIYYPLIVNGRALRAWASVPP